MQFVSVFQCSRGPSNLATPGWGPQLLTLRPPTRYTVIKPQHEPLSATPLALGRSAGACAAAVARQNITTVELSVHTTTNLAWRSARAISWATLGVRDRTQRFTRYPWTPGS